MLIGNVTYYNYLTAATGMSKNGGTYTTYGWQGTSSNDGPGGEVPSDLTIDGVRMTILFNNGYYHIYFTSNVKGKLYNANKNTLITSLSAGVQKEALTVRGANNTDDGGPGAVYFIAD